jgi:HD-like signal output (HDOD) protein
MLVGLLHDMGKIIFSIYFPNEYAEVWKRAATEKVPLHKIERKTLGLDHAQTAYLLMERWGFPEDIVQPVRYHHDPSVCPKDQVHMALAVNTANLICGKAGIGQSGDHGRKRDQEILARLQLSDDAIDMLAQEMESERDQVESFLAALS